MGNYTSKLFANHCESDSKSKLQTLNVSGNSEKHQCTPIMTRRCLSTDPRSATIGIVRTPIEVDSTPTGVCKRTASAIPKYLQIKPYLETDIDSVMDALTPERRIPDPRSPNVTCQRTPIIMKDVPGYPNLPAAIDGTPQIDSIQNSMTGLDPRSPAINFDRTPIMKPKSPGNIDKMSHDNVAKCSTETLSVPMLYCETTIDCIIPEVQALPAIVSEKPPSFDERLDACNDIMDENSSKCGSDTDLSTDESDSEGQITVIPNMNALKDYSEALNIHDTIDEELQKESTDVKDHNPLDMIAKSMIDSMNGNAREKIRVWRDSTSPICLTESRTEVFKAPEEIIIEFDDEQPVVKSYNKFDAVGEKINENKTNNGIFAEKKKNMQHFNKDIKLIYDDAKEYNANGTVIIDTQRNRTPLGNRSNNHKSALMTKSPQQLLRNKGLSTKSQQQENTPPRTKRGKTKNKSNVTQWDLDRTVVI